MNLHSGEAPPEKSNEIAIEELKQLIGERRFVMTSYMQALALYIALEGYGIKELLANSDKFALVLAGLFTALNMVAVYAAGRFRSMAVHAMSREQELAELLGVKRPHSLIWGYGAGLIVVILYETAVIIILFFKFGGSSHFIGLTRR